MKKQSMSIILYAGLLLMAATATFAASLTHGPVVGGVTPNEAQVFVRTNCAATVTIRYAPDPTLINALVTNPFTTTSTSDFTRIIPLTGLTPQTTYYLDVVVDGVGQFSPPYPSFGTFPATNDPQPFTFIILTDFVNTPNAPLVPTFLNAALEGGAFAFIGGDFDHRDSRGLGDFVNLILRRMPIVHHWDDQDAGGRNLDKTYPNWDLSYQAFREYVPTYPLPATPTGIWQRFRYAHVEFFVLDNRSQRDPATDPDDASKSMLDGNNLGAAGQLEWLKTGLLTSTATWRILFSSVVTNPTTKFNDGWAAYQTEWQNLREFIAENNITGVVFVSGDLHIGGIDDATAAGFPEMVVPSVNTQDCLTGNVVGTWSEGVYRNQAGPCYGYGVVTVLTNPDRLLLEVKDENGNAQLSFQYELPTTPPPLFQRTSATAGVKIVRPTYGNPLWGDLDNNGNLDILVINHGNPPSVWQNNGDGTFTDIRSSSGITFTEDRHGASWGDYNNDGNLDLFITTGGEMGAGLGTKKDELYRNEGNGSFTNVTDLAGVSNTFGRGRSVNWVDVNNDGLLDLFVKNIQSPNVLYQNNGNGTFTDVALAMGIADASGEISSWIDYDNDGDMDLFTGGGNKREQLWRNNGNGTFTEVTAAAGLNNILRGRGVAWGDYNNDGWIDLYIARGFKETPNVLSWNPATIFFGDTENIAENGLDFTTSGDQVTFDLYQDAGICRFPERTFIGGQNTSPFSIPFTLTETEAIGQPVYVPGQDRGFFLWKDDTGWHIRWSIDGQPSNFYGKITSNGQFMTVQPVNFTPTPSLNTTNRLYRNNGDGTFTEVAAVAGVASTRNERGAIWGDYDNDGYLDLFVVNTGSLQANGLSTLYHNNGDGTFSEVTEPLGVLEGRGDGAAWGDYNNDGFLDLFITNGWEPSFQKPETENCLVLGPHLLYANTGNGNKWLKITLVGTLSNRDGIGARVALQSGGLMQFREVNGGGGGQFFSQGSSGPLHFGLGQVNIVDSLTIFWPSGIAQVLTNIAANQSLTIVEE